MRAWRRGIPRFSIWIEQVELQRAEMIAASACPNETGGILIGARSAQRIWILTALEIPTPIPRPSRYTLRVDNANPVLWDYLVENQLPPEVGYVGTWHTHPGSIGPSARDLASARQDSAAQQQPVALVVLSHIGGQDWKTHGVIAAQKRSHSAAVTVDGANPTMTT